MAPVIDVLPDEIAMMKADPDYRRIFWAWHRLATKVVRLLVAEGVDHDDALRVASYLWDCLPGDVYPEESES